MVLVCKKYLVNLFGSSTIYLSWLTVICLSAKHNVICQFLWGSIHYYAFHGLQMEVIGCSESIPRNMVTPLGLFAGLYMSALSIRY